MKERPKSSLYVLGVNYLEQLYAGGAGGDAPVRDRSSGGDHRRFDADQETAVVRARAFGHPRRDSRSVLQE